MLPGKCLCPGCWRPGWLRRQNTQYADDRQNWSRLCDLHQEETDAYWQERWDEYWSGLL
jgi:hypothetical protein